MTQTETWYPEDSVDLTKMLRDLLGMLVGQWRDKGYQAPRQRLYVALEEALLNAWNHGNKKDSAKSIELKWRYANDFSIEIIDQGQGFDPSHLASPTTDSNRLLENGRGVFMIRHAADDVFWKDDGRRIVLLFKLKPN